MKNYISNTVEEAKKKLEFYCSYQERCHAEVMQKLKELNMIKEAADLIIVHLIENNFLNETRFAASFARGKHRIKSWGKIRIINELKARHISKYNIDQALKEISEEEYATTFYKTATLSWNSIKETNIQKKRKKFCDYMLRKGFESNLIYTVLKELEDGIV